MTGYEWLTAQDQTAPSNKQWEAIGYLEALLQAEDSYLLFEVLDSAAKAERKESTKFRTSHFCFGGDKVTVGQIGLVAKKWMNEHPEKLSSEAYFLIKSALIDAWPCANNPAKASVR